MKSTPTGPKIVVIGGGTGTFTVLTSLKHYAQDITAVVNMIDDGGSTGILRDELGVLPPGDVRQSLVALSSSSRELRELFNYRFPEGTFAGHAFGNLFLTALEKVTGSFAEAVEVASKVLSIQGKVLPASTDDARLVLETNSGRVIRGEDRIGEGPIDDQLFVKGEPHHLYLEPKATLNLKAKQAIAKADLIVITPGKLYSSIIPSFLIGGMSEALREARAKKVYVCNLMTRPTQTAGFSVQDFAAELERYNGGPFLDYVIYNTEHPAASLLRRYALGGEEPVNFDQEILSRQTYRAIGDHLIAHSIPPSNANDTLLKRTLIRHDSDKLARLIMRIYFS
ncbi:MAG: hypothetical protein JWN01_396 [Patescibacteria group bacterium]|nr:hypothetical protein [Patescibacteria group bacterium]